MSLARGLTKRIRRADPSTSSSSSPAMPSARRPSIKNTAVKFDRSQISAPVALVSTTNMLSYNAPDIGSIKTTSPSTASSHSADDSDASRSTRSRASSHASRDDLTDATSVSSSPTSPAPNHLSGYFAAANKNLRKSVSSGNLQQLNETVEEEPVPAIPERALSHSKRAHERIARKRSLQNLSRHTPRPSGEHRISTDMATTAIQEEFHPFGKELEQLNEVVEEFNGTVMNAKEEADTIRIRERCLANFCAADYLAEIQPLYIARFDSTAQPASLAWI